MIYTVHMASDARPAPGDETGESMFDSLTAIPEAKATWALLVPPLWLAYHRLWWELAIYGLATVLILGLLATPYAIVALLLSGFPGLYLLLEGHQLRRNHLSRLGYNHVATVDASSPNTALARFLSQWRAPRQVARTSLTPLSGKGAQGDDLAFGLFPESEV